MTPSPCSSADLGDLIARTTRGRPWEPRERPFRFLLDSRLFRILCDPRQEAALDNFKASVARLRLAPAGGLPDLEMTPLAILHAIGVEIPAFPTIPLPESMLALKAIEIAVLIKEQIQKSFGEETVLEAAHLQKRVDQLRQAASPAAHELFDLCVTRAVSRETFRESLLEQMVLETLFTFRYPEECRERMGHLFTSFLLNTTVQVSGLTKMRRLKILWERSLERLLKKNPGARAEILAVDQEMRPRSYRDYLGWEVIHHSILGSSGKQVQPVVAFTPEPEERLRARCKGHKTALRAFLDNIPPEELAGELRPLMAAWRPGWLVPCRADGAFEAPFATGEVTVWTAPSPS